MSNIKLDLSKFKHVKSDKNTTTLQHAKDGHIVTLMHNALNPANKAQLEALSNIGKENRTSNQSQEAQDEERRKHFVEGGGVWDTIKDVASKAQEIYSGDFGATTKAADKERAAKQNAPHYANGGNIKMYADPQQEVSPKDSAPVADPNQVMTPMDQNANKSPIPGVNININSAPPMSQEPQPVAETPKETIKPTPTPEEITRARVAGLGHLIGDAAEGAKNFVKNAIVPQALDAKGMPVTEQPAPAAPNQGLVPQATAATPQVGQQQATPAPIETPDQVAVKEVQADPNNPPVIKEASAPIEKTYQDHKNEIHQDIVKESQETNQDLLNGHITPKTYQNIMGDKSFLSRLGTAFGMLLSDAGSGLSRQPNAMFAMMDNMIKQDLDSQIKSKENAQNLYRLQQQHELNKAHEQNLQADTSLKTYALTKIKMNQIALHKLAADVEKFPVGSPQRQQAETTLAMMNSAVQNDNFNLADRAAAAGAYQRMVLGTSGQQGGNGQEIPDPAKEIRKKQLIGIMNPEQASKALEEVGKVENHRKLNENALDSFDTVAKMATLASKVTNPVQNSKRIDAEWYPMMDKLVKDNEGRVTPITVDMMSALKPELTDNAATVALKRQKMNAILNNGFATPVNDSFGVRLDKGASASAPSQQVVVGKDGKKYVRQGNYMVPVK